MPSGCSLNNCLESACRYLSVNLNRQRASQVADFAAAAIAAVAFVSWWVWRASPPLLSSWGLSAATVKPATALYLVALGLALAHPRRELALGIPGWSCGGSIAALNLLVDLVSILASTA